MEAGEKSSSDVGSVACLFFLCGSHWDVLRDAQINFGGMQALISQRTKGRHLAPKKINSKFEDFFV